ncbi:hypothetical protein CC78DRAFT_581562 [Lojkania enalia]|uniref:Thioesterase domain-containing protein n=1 Tax=Lojkania enalia TaxID=147567 RepID=A0A9P4K5Y5_9PLEO|nr:hypothetical protein CC78DRAFT_581562 [Didymosphaeria enalia]
MYNISYSFTRQLPKAAPRLQLLIQSSNIRLLSLSSITPQQSRFRIAYLWYAICLTSGTAAGYTIRKFLTPLELPLPGSSDDDHALDTLAAELDALDIVKTMRAQGYHLHSDTPLNELGKGKGGWMELDIGRNITESAVDKVKAAPTISQKALAGLRGFGVQRAFWNSETRELIAVVWMGGAISGWPGIAHGGAIAILFEDSMTRLVAGPHNALDSSLRPSSMSITYSRPTEVLKFYVLRASFDTLNLPQSTPPPEPLPPKSWVLSWKDLTKKPAPIPEPMVELSGTLETLQGKVCVRAKGTFPSSAVSKNTGWATENIRSTT